MSTDGKVIDAHLYSYRYDGPHRHWNPLKHAIDPGHEHYDWRYVIKVNGLTVVYRQGFCRWERAHASLTRSLKRVNKALI
jgi:hypothetical protein